MGPGSRWNNLTTGGANLPGRLGSDPVIPPRMAAVSTLFGVRCMLSSRMVVLSAGLGSYVARSAVPFSLGECSRKYSFAGGLVLTFYSGRFVML